MRSIYIPISLAFCASIEGFIPFFVAALNPTSFLKRVPPLIYNKKNKRAIPTLVIIQGATAIGGMMIKGINALVDAKRASSFNNAIKLVNGNVQITHDRLITLENRTAMMAKAIIPVLKDFKEQINNTMIG